MKSVPLWLGLILLLLADASNAQQSGRNIPLTVEQREQWIQRAVELRKQENYSGAASQLDSILQQNAVDAPILLFKGDLLLQAKRFADAAITYKQLLPLNFEPTITQINLSYALFMHHQPAKALVYAKNAWLQNKTNSNAVVNYFNALLWNSKTNEAAFFLRKQDSLLTPAQQLVLKARHYTTSGNYNEGLRYYDSLIKLYPDKYYVQEYAEVLLGKKEIQQSVAIMQKSKDLFSSNEYNAYQQKIKATQQQTVGTEMIYFKDVAKNVRLENSIWWQQSEERKYRLRLSAGQAVYTSESNEKTTVQFTHLHMDERWNRAWSGETDLHLQLIQTSTGINYTGLTGQQTIKYQPKDRRMFGVYYSTDILNYTASLLGKNIRSNNLGYITHIMLNGKTGFYSQGSAGLLTDKNRRYQFFGSLYHLVRTEPTVKAGINLSALHFADSSIKNYFSPNRYLNTEIFADFSTPLPVLSKFYLQFQAAAGMQKIEKNNWEPAFRMQSEVGIRVKKIETALKYQTSNVASANGTGYSFNWFTARFVWKW
ncbi:MAG TPA: tetratricopeptide repeat protein [Lacibacter sp.]|nr:tetratricopeptide repeat protein [Lacibacter sp.]